MRVPRAVGRPAYRVAYLLLVAFSRVVRPHTRGVKCLPVCGGDVLLVRHSYGPAQWDLPGGFCRRGEDFEAAARREVAEELGLAATGFTDAGELRQRHQGRHETLRIFRVEVERREVAIRSVEVAETRWFARAALPDELAPIVRSVLALDAGLSPDEGG
jgi:ADP-ribose pyrophosphatase YjhB (NUDIX family)